MCIGGGWESWLVMMSIKMYSAPEYDDNNNTEEPKYEQDKIQKHKIQDN